MNTQGHWAPRIAWREPSAAGFEIVVRPKEPDLAALAADIGAEAVPSFTATLLVRRWFDGMEITGRIEAVVTRICGVSLDAFDEVVDEALALRFVPVGSPYAIPADGKELIIDPDEPDPPEEVGGEAVDLAAVLTEQLALALDPFPRKPGASFEPVAAEAEFSPFAALARLKTDLGKS